jgi:hypothetical protein
MTSKISEVNFNDFNQVATNQEGIVLLGTGGDLQEWTKGVCDILLKEEITKTNNPNELFSEFYKLTTTGGRTDLAMIFNSFDNFEMGKMAIWKLAFGDCSWISDYIVNYAEQHGVIIHYTDDFEE